MEITGAEGLLRDQIFIATPHCTVALREQVLRCTVEPGRVVV